MLKIDCGDIKMSESELREILTNLVGGFVSTEIVETKLKDYIKSGSKLEMAAFIYNDLSRLVGGGITEAMSEYLEKSFGIGSDEIVTTATYIKKNNICPGQMPIDDNHKLVSETLKMLCDKLAEAGIDYYLVGALPCYLLTGAEDTRYHDDIDLMLNEVDIPKARELFANTDFDFKDLRINTPKRLKGGMEIPSGDHEVVAQHRNSEFHIGFFCFERDSAGAVIHKDYFLTPTDELMVYKHIISKEQSDLYYDDNVHQHDDISFKMASLESIYNIKKHMMNNPGREKDKTDVEMIEHSGMLNLEKLSQIKNAPHIEPSIEKVSVDEPIVPKESRNDEPQSPAL